MSYCRHCGLSETAQLFRERKTPQNVFCGVSCQRAWHQIGGCFTQAIVDEEEYRFLKHRRGMTNEQVLKDLYETEPLATPETQLKVINWMLHDSPIANRGILKMLTTAKWAHRVPNKVLTMVINYNRKAFTQEDLIRALGSRRDLLAQYSDYALLEKAIYDNDFKAVRRLLKKFSWMTEKENLIRTALRTKYRNTDMIRFLLDDPTIVIDQGAFGQVVRSDREGGEEILRMLLDDPRSHPEELDNYALEAALKYDKNSMLRMLLVDERVTKEVMKDPNYWTPMFEEWIKKQENKAPII